MKNEQTFEKLALDKEITKKILGGLLDEGNNCADQSIQPCSAGVVKYQSVKCKLDGDWVMTYCVHPNESEAAAIHPTSWTIPHYYCYQPYA